MTIRNYLVILPQNYTFSPKPANNQFNMLVNLLNIENQTKQKKEKIKNMKKLGILFDYLFRMIKFAVDAISLVVISR